VPFRRLTAGLLVSGLASLSVIAGMGPADAAVIVKGNGMKVTVVGAHLGTNHALNVHFAVSCGMANDEKADAGAPDTTPDTWILLDYFTLSQTVNGTVVSNQLDSNNEIYQPITCDQKSHPFTFTFHPTAGATWYTAGPAQLSNVEVATLDSDFSCGYATFNGQTVPSPCNGTPAFSTAVSITH
jgi:hypothetical protein